MSGGPEVRQQLAEALWDFDAATGAGIPDDELADALLPVVDRIADERAAQALAEVAQRFRDLGQAGAYCVVQARAEAMAAGRQKTPTPGAADTGVPTSDRTQGAARTAGPVADHRPARRVSATSPARQAAAVLSDAELNDALELWYQRREADHA